MTSSGLYDVTASGSLGAFSTSNGLTLALTSGSADFAGAASTQTAGYTVSGVASQAGLLSGTFTSNVAAEFGSIADVNVAYTANAVNQRTFGVTNGNLSLGRFLITGALPSATTDVTSSGLYDVTASGSLAGFSTSNGLTLALTSGSADFAGAVASQTAGYTVSGAATTAGLLSGTFTSNVSAEFGSISPVSVAYTANAVNQRTFSLTTGTVSFGRYLVTEGLTSATTGVTSSGLFATTATGSLGAFSTSNGLSLALTSGSALFDGSVATQTAEYTLSGTPSQTGLISGSFVSNVTAEFGSIAPVVVDYSLNPVAQRTFSVTSGTVAVGRYLISGAVPTATTGVTSSGLYAETASGSLGAFSTSNGLTLALTSGSADFAGATAIQTAGYAVAGTASSAGLLSGTFTSNVAAEFGSIPAINVAYTANPVDQRTFSVTNSSLSLGRYLISGALPSGTTGVTSSGLYDVTASGSLGAFSTSNGLTLALTSGSADFAGLVASQTAGYTVTGSTSTAGLLSGTFTSNVGAEFGSISSVNVAYTANAVNQRTFGVTNGNLSLGRFLITGALPSATTDVTSSGLYDVTASGSLGAFSTSNGLTLALTSGSADFAGAASTQTAGYTVSGVASQAGLLSGTFTSNVAAEFGSIADVNVAYTANAVNQRTFGVTNGNLSLGRFLITGALPSATTDVTSSGLYDVTASGSLAGFSTSNGLTLALTSGSADFAGAVASQTAGYTVSGAATTAGLLSGTFTSNVSAEFGSISPVSVAYTANAVNQRTFSLTTGTVSFGRYLVTEGLTSATTGVTSSGLFATTATGSLGAFSTSNGLSLALTSGSALFDGSVATQTAEYTLSGTPSQTGLISGSFVSNVTAEFGSIAPVVVDYSLNPVAQRTFSVTSGTVAVGRYLISGAVPTATTGVTSSGLYAETASGSLGAFSTSNGLTLALTSGSADFAGATAIQTAGYAVAGTASSAGLLSGTFTSAVAAEFGSIPAINVAYTANPVNQRVLTTNTSAVSLGVVHQGAAINASSLVVTSTGLNAETANATVGSFSGGLSGLSLGLTSGTAAFNGSVSSQTAGYSLSGTLATAGVLTGTYTAAVATEFGTIPSLSLAVEASVFSGAATWNVNGSGSWGSGASSSWTSFGGVQAAPGTFAGFADTDTATFGGALTSGTGVVSLGASAPSLAGLTFNNQTASYELSGGMLSLNGGAGSATVSTVAGSHRIASDVSLSTAAVFDVASSAALSVPGVVAGSGNGITKTGGGQLTLGGANSYTGATSILGGTVVAAVDSLAGQAGAFGNATSPVSVGSGAANSTGLAALLLAGGVQTTRNLEVAALGSGGTQQVVLGGAGTSGTATFGGTSLQVGRDLVLQAATGGVVNFAAAWQNAVGGSTLSNSFTVGSTGNAGTVLLSSNLDTTGGLTVVNGELQLADATQVTLGSPLVLDPGTELTGLGQVNAFVGGAGQVAPGMSPGIQTLGGVNPTSGLDFAFEFTSLSPNYGTASASLNDLVRLTSVSPSPFTAAMTQANVIDLYLPGNVAYGQVYQGGFFTDATATQYTSFFDDIKNATYNVYVLDNAGTTTYKGNNYSPLSQNLWVDVGTATVPSAGYAGGAITDGQISQFVVVPEPTSLALAVAGVAAAALALRRRKSR